jgi:hypothetical protein
VVKSNQISIETSVENNLSNIILLLTGIVFVLVLVIRIFHINVYTTDLFGYEQDEIYTIQHVLSDLPIYNDPEEAPFSITQKTPLYHIFTGEIGKIVGVNPSDPFQVYQLNRSISLILALITCGIGFLILYRILSSPFKLSLILSMIIFIAMEGHMFTRPDGLFSLSFLITIASNIIYVQKRDNRFLWLSIFLGVVTIFVKQTGIILPVITLAYVLFFERDFKKLLTGAFVAILTFGLLLLILSKGAFSIFFANTIGGLNNGINVRWFYDFIYKFTYQKFALFFIFGLYCSWEWLSKDNRSRLTDFLSLALILDFIFTHFISLKWGSTPSYFSEFVHLSILAVPVYYQRIKFVSFRSSISKLAFLSSIALIPLLTSGKRLMASISFSDEVPFQECEKIRDYLTDHYKEEMKEWIFTDDELLKLYLYKNSLLPQEDISYRSFTTNQFDYKRYFQILKIGAVPILVSKNSLKEIEKNDWYLFSSFSEYYHKVESVDGFHIYRYHPKSDH